MGKSLRVLIVEDSEEDTTLLLRELKRGGYEVVYQRVDSTASTQAALRDQAWDLVLSDYRMPHFSAPEALNILKASGLDLPFIIISGAVTEDVVVSALKAGAHDFISKSNFAKLGPAIERELVETEMRREERQARASEDLFGTAFVHSPVGICITGVDGKLQKVSQSLLEMLGYTRAELEGKHFNDITHPDDLLLGRDVVERMVAGDIPSVSFEKRYLHKNGEPIWALVSASLLRDPQGKPVHFITHILNMTERKRAEEQRRASATRLKVLADASQTFATVVHDYQEMLEIVARQTAEAMHGSCGVRLLSDDGQWLEMVAIHDVDPRALELTRRLSSQPLPVEEPHFVQPIMQSQGPRVLSGISEEQLRAVIQQEDWAHLEYIASQSRLLAPIRTRNQALGFLIISRRVGSADFDEHDLSLAQDLADRAALAISNARLFQQVQNELTERKQTDEALRESQVRLAGVIDSAMDAIITIDAGQNITLFNPAAEHIFGYPAEDVIGKPLEMLLPERFRRVHRMHIERFGETDVTTRTMGTLGVLRGLRADGQEFPIEASISHLEVAGQRFFTVILRDISERVQAEQAALESEARYQRVLDAMMEGCQIIDFDWRYVYVNDVVAAQGKQTRQELISHRMMEIYPGIENTELFTVLRECMEQRIPKRLENPFVFPDGTTGWFELSIQPAREGIFILSTDITERKRAEEALKLENERFQRFIDSNIVGIVIANASGAVIAANDYYLKLLGLTRQDFLDGRVDWRELTPPEWNAADEKALAELREFGVCQPYEKEYERADGTRIPVYLADAMLPGPGEQIVAFVLDLTERKRAEALLRRSEENFAKAFSSSPTALMITGRADGKYLALNEAYARLVGYTREELLGHLTTEFNIFLYPHQRQEIMNQLLTKGALYNYEAQIQDKAGNLRTVLAALEFIEFNGENCILTTLVDITERNQAEERFRLVVESAPNAILLVNQDGRIEMANSQAEKFFGYDRTELVGLTVDQLVPQPIRELHQGHRQKYLQALETRAMGVGRDLHGVRKNGTEFPVEIGLTPVTTQEGLLVIATIVDITERKQSEHLLKDKNEELKAMSQQLWQAAKLATMGELAASIAHELNNPLATVSLRTEMLAGQFDPGDPEAKSLRIIDSEVKRMSVLVANLLQFSRQSGAQISTINVNEELTNTLELVQYHLRKNAILTVQELSPDLPMVQADRQQLRQVFLNLFTNAADAMSRGGMLVIRTWAGEEPEAGITAPLRPAAAQALGLPVADTPQVFIEVSDSGEGITPETLQRVWEPFYTTKPEGKGTGLGLAICRRIVQEHGGTIELISDGVPGKGTTVRLSLPAVKGQ